MRMANFNSFMNTQILVLLFISNLIIQKSIVAQSNLSFENWSYVQNVAEPTGWTTNNSSSFPCIYPDSNATDGNLSVRIESTSWFFEGPGKGEVSQRMNTNQFIDTIFFDIDIDTLTPFTMATVYVSGSRYDSIGVFSNIRYYENQTNGFVSSYIWTKNIHSRMTDQVFLSFRSFPASNGAITFGFSSIRVDNIRLTSSEISSEEQALASEEILVSPNPAHQDFIDLKSNQTINELIVMDTQGREIKRIPKPHKTIAIEWMPKGLYIFYFIQQDKTQFSRFIRL